MEIATLDINDYPWDYLFVRRNQFVDTFWYIWQNSQPRTNHSRIEWKRSACVWLHQRWKFTHYCTEAIKFKQIIYILDIDLIYIIITFNFTIHTIM